MTLWREYQAFKRELKKADDQRKKAGETATRVEAYRLSGILKKEIKVGAPGGRSFKPLSTIGRTTGRPKNRTPLKRLAVPVRYNVVKDSSGTTFEVGFVDSRSGPLSQSWKRIAERQQAGGMASLSTPKRRILGMFLAEKGGKARGGTKRYFFLKKSTRRFYLPARPIIDPFWDAHESEAGRNIAENFRRKMRGERI